MIIIVEPNIKEVKFWAFNKDSRYSSFIAKDIDELRDKKALEEVIYTLTKGKKPKTIVFKMLFGADLFKKPVLLNDKALTELRKLVSFMPFYIPMAEEILRSFYENFKGVQLILFFDTAFFSNLPYTEKYYAIPVEYAERNKIKRWGFHGIYHEYNGTLPQKGGKIISVVLDKQATVCAIKDNKPFSISLGYTPLEGIMGRTSCGDLDPGIVFYLMKRYKFSIFAIDEMLKKESGFLGVTGYDLGIDELVKLCGSDQKVDLAFRIYQDQILKYIGEGISSLGGVDAIVFSGCYLKNLLGVTHNLLKNISFLGINLLQLPWESNKETNLITSEKSPIKVYLNFTEPANIIYQLAFS